MQPNQNFAVVPPARHILTNIQALRAIAASMVVLDHTMLTTEYGAPEFAWILGAVGVFIFFTVSGFIMAHTTWSVGSGRAGAVDFAIKRVLRVVPLYWIFTAAVVVQNVRKDVPISPADILRSALFIPFADESGAMRPVLHQGWTLNFEMMFYALFASSLLLPKRFRTLGALSALSVLAASHSIASNFFWRSVSDPVILLFGGGIAASLVSRSVTVPQRYHIPFLGLVASGCCMVAIMWLQPTYPPSAISKASVWLICVVLVFVSATSIQNRDGLTSNVINLVGNASYSTYLCHNFVLSPVMKLIGNRLDGGAVVILLLVVANVVGILIHICLENPLGRWLGVMHSAATKRLRKKYAIASTGGITEPIATVTADLRL